MKIFYIVLCALGLILPYSQFIPWVIEHGMDLSALFLEITNSRISAFAWLDVLVSAAALIGFILVEGTRQGMRYLWLPILATFSVGVSLGLPLFLLMRELSREKSLLKLKGDQAAC